jgi:drug/metabolite transporter (DMT)-like permease
VKIIVLILASVILSSIAQLVLKLGMSSLGVQEALASNMWSDIVMAVVAGGLIPLGIALYGVGAVLWLWILSRTDLSFAYPFVGVAFILTMLFGLVFLGEPVGIERIAGTFLIVCGVTLVSRS